MKEICLNYDPNTGMVYDGLHTYIGCKLAIVEVGTSTKENTDSCSVLDLVKLKSAGFTTEDIIDMHQKGLV